MKALDDITYHKHFDKIAGVLALANPVALTPAIIAIYNSPNAEGQSVWMWIIFLVIQVVFVLVSAKARNFGAFISMAISVFMSFSAIVMMLLK